MPGKSKQSKSKYVRRRGNAQARLPLYRGMRNVMAINPGRLVVTLPYADVFTLTSTIGVPGYTIFRANSCYDPDVTGAGHQPRGLDQYFSIYQHGRVLKSWCEFRFVADQGNTVPVIVSSTISTVTSALDTNDAMESQRNVSKLLSLPSGGASQDVIYQSFYPGESYNKETISNQTFTPSADCNYQTYWNFQVAPVGSSTTCSVRCALKLYYTVEFTDFALPAQS